MRSTLLLVLTTLATLVGVAVAGVTLDLGYEFAPGAKTAGCVSASIDGVEMGRDVPLAVTGEAAVDLTLEVVAVDDEGIATLRATFGRVTASLLGEPQEASTPSPVELRVNDRGALVAVQSEDTPELDLFASGGVPLELVVLMVGVVELPDGPVELGESWTIERCQQVPQVGEVIMRVTSRIVEIADGEVAVITDLSASLPDFTTPNPLQQGDVTVSNGVLTISDMRRTVDTSTGLIKSAEARMVFDGAAALGPFPPLPLRVTSSFRIVPPAEQDQAALPGGARHDG